MPRRRNTAASVALLDWYDRHARVLPWRMRGPGQPDPYHVWLSEIMLQQTTVKAVIPYYQAFLRRWPAVDDMAAAPLEDVLAAWAGLGYYARARNLHACSKAVVEKHGGRFPDTEAALRSLPGIGAYTAAAIAAIAFGRRAIVMDGNVERVIARLEAIETPLPRAKQDIREALEQIVPESRSGDIAQAMMDLGATICTPSNPACALCPWRERCKAHAQGLTARLPVKAIKPVRPERFGVAFVAMSTKDRVLLRRRPEKGLLGSMLEVPNSPWTDAPPFDAMTHAPFSASWRPLSEQVRHIFTHFALTLDVHFARNVPENRANGSGEWYEPEFALKAGVPALMRKVLEVALGGTGKRVSKRTKGVTRKIY